MTPKTSARRPRSAPAKYRSSTALATENQPRPVGDPASASLPFITRLFDPFRPYRISISLLLIAGLVCLNFHIIHITDKKSVLGLFCAVYSGATALLLMVLWTDSPPPPASAPSTTSRIQGGKQMAFLGVQGTEDTKKAEWGRRGHTVMPGPAQMSRTAERGRQGLQGNYTNRCHRASQTDGP